MLLAIVTACGTSPAPAPHAFAATSIATAAPTASAEVASVPSEAASPASDTPAFAAEVTRPVCPAAENWKPPRAVTARLQKTHVTEHILVRCKIGPIGVILSCSIINGVDGADEVGNDLVGTKCKPATRDGVRVGVRHTFDIVLVAPPAPATSATTAP